MEHTAMDAVHSMDKEQGRSGWMDSTVLLEQKLSATVAIYPGAHMTVATMRTLVCSASQVSILTLLPFYENNIFIICINK